MEGIKLAACTPTGTLTHDLINRLSIIVGMVISLKDAPSQKRVLLIGQIARSAAEELGRYHCQLAVLASTAETENLSLSRRT